MSETSVAVLAAQVRAGIAASIKDSLRSQQKAVVARDALDSLVGCVVEAERRATEKATDNQRDFWRQRYETQHKTVHRMEDTIAELRAALADARDALERLAKAAADEAGPKERAPEKDLAYWAALAPTDHVPGVQRRIELARATLAAREVLVRRNQEPE